MVDIYTNGSYQRHNPSWHAEDSKWKASKILRFLKAYGLAPKSVCDVGCGSGGVIFELSKSMTDTIFSGYDISEYAIAKARGQKNQNVDFFVGLPPEKKSDLVMLIDVLEHIEDCSKLLKNFKSYGDFQLFHIPLNLSVIGVLKKDFYIRERLTAGHIHIFSKDMVLSQLQEHGYEIINWEYTSPAIDRCDSRLVSRLGKIARVIGRTVNPDLAAKIMGGFSLLVLTKSKKSD